jgi:hypothetical protein
VPITSIPSLLLLVAMKLVVHLEISFGMMLTGLFQQRLQALAHQAQHALFIINLRLVMQCNKDDKSIKMDYDEEQAYQWVRCSVDHGSKLIQNNGIYKFLHNDTA